jgi:hypothetical protein
MNRRPLHDIDVLLQRRDNSETSPPAPAHGLYFVAATYPPELFEHPVGEARAAALLG